MSGIVRIPEVRARLVAFDWTWARRNATGIAANWERRRSATPKIFNGRVLMLSDLRIAAGSVEADFFATDYAALLAWADSGCPDGSVANGFAMGALVGRDGGFILGEMAAGTANAGRLYFPCGTPDMSDVTADDLVDLGASLEREIAEETGLPPSCLEVEPRWTIIREGGLCAFIRTVRLTISAEEAEEMIRLYLSGQVEPELSRISIVRAPEDMDASRMPAVVPIFLRDAFAAVDQG